MYPRLIQNCCTEMPNFPSLLWCAWSDQYTYGRFLHWFRVYWLTLNVVWKKFVACISNTSTFFFAFDTASANSGNVTGGLASFRVNAFNASGTYSVHRKIHTSRRTPVIKLIKSFIIFQIFSIWTIQTEAAEREISGNFSRLLIGSNPSKSSSELSSLSPPYCLIASRADIVSTINSSYNPKSSNRK